MIEPKDVGKLIIDGKLQDERYDRNAPYGFDGSGVTFYGILVRILLFGFCITISRKSKELKHSRDFSSLAFDPPEK